MFQSQIYQKWGLRKTKPGEAKKEAKGRKRVREDSEDVESIASSSRSQELATAETMSVSGKSTKSSSSAGPAPSQPRKSQPQKSQPEVVSESLDSHATTAQAKDSQSSDQDNSDSHTTKSNPKSTAPRGWTDFLSQGQIALPLSGDDQTTAMRIIPMYQIETDQFFADGHPASAANDEGSWISTVMLPSPPSSIINPPPLQLIPSVPSRSWYTTKKPRRSRSKSPLDDTTSSSSRSSGRAVGAIRRPMASIHHLDPPTALLLPEKSMFYARHFISSTFTTGIWALSQSTEPTLFDTECGKLERWYNDFNPGFDLLRQHRVKKGFRLLKRCFANTTLIIEPQDPRVAIYICQQAIRCMFYDTLGRDLSRTLLRYITGLCRVIFGLRHPLYIVVDQLSRMDSFEFAQNIRPFMDCYFEHLEPFLEGSANAFGHITEMRGLTISLLEGTGMMGVYEAKPIMDRLIKKAESYGLSSLQLKVETAAILQRNRFFTEALDLLAEVRDMNERAKSPYEWHYAGIMLILTLRKMDDRDGAIRVAYELVDYLSQPFSKFPGYPNDLSMSLRQYMESRPSSLLLVLGKLEKDLRDAERIDEADKIQSRLDRGVAQEYGCDADEDPEAALNAMATP